MKYSKKWSIYSTLAGLMALTASCKQEPSPFDVIRQQNLDSFPSASAIEYAGGRLYLLGDDAAYLAILDTGYAVIDTVRFLPDTSYRQSKETKIDIESATIVQAGGQQYLYALSSFSAPVRNQLVVFPLSDPRRFTLRNARAFVSTFRSIREMNIEGMATMRNGLILVNRANKTHPSNTLVLSGLTRSAGIAQKSIAIDLGTEKVIGVSGLHYLPALDLLLFTASEEDTPSATQDGTIGDSHLGYINSFTRRLGDSVIRPDRLINLTASDGRFSGQKIESICVETLVAEGVIVHLAADNDNGKSTLFKLKLRL